ncbi:MAG: hypothetical protein CM15mP44_4030 [Candidatus Neomarinimicrobiota bacterium]|nr:MAG: hypothetical protein CM15mP44_4030 [Candidatus Neomarinimicrobiota bacterium]
MKITTGEIPANYRINLGVQKSFLQNRLSATFKVDDIFNTGKFIIDTDNEVTNSATGETYRQLMYAERQRQRRFASIVLNYNFGKQKRKSGAEVVFPADLVEWVVEWIWTINLWQTNPFNHFFDFFWRRIILF